jgi:hypothetical protein
MWENIENYKIEEQTNEVKKLEYNDIQDFYNPGEIKLI